MIKKIFERLKLHDSKRVHLQNVFRPRYEKFKPYESLKAFIWLAFAETYIHVVYTSLVFAMSSVLQVWKILLSSCMGNDQNKFFCY